MSNFRVPKSPFSASNLSAPLVVASTIFILPAAAFASPDHMHFRDFKAQNVGMDRATLRANFHAQSNGGSQLGASHHQPTTAGVISHEHTSHVRTDSDHIIRNSTQETAAGNLIRLNSGIDIDFNSQERNIVLGDKLFAHTTSVKIDVGGQEKTLSAGDHVTAAEYAAVKQVLFDGAQHITVDAEGRAAGGQVDLSAITAKGDRMNVQDLSISDNLSVYGDFGRSSAFQVSGDLVNAGSIYVYSSRSGARAGLIQADNITNEKDALISTSLPESSLGRGADKSPLDVTLKANHTLSNFGTITISGNLNVDAPQIVNHGSMQSDSKNVQLNSPGELNINNNGGTISAAYGSITVRDRSYTGSFNTDVTGGALLSKTLDVNCGGGTADLNVQSISGVVNETGFASHVTVADDVLNLGNICLAGDPTYKNSLGSIQLNGNILVQEALAIIARGSISNTTKLTIDAGSSNNGFPITLIAGAEFVTNAGTDSPNLGPFPPVPAGVGTSITGDGSTTGGSIFLGTGAGGKVTITSQATNKTGSSNAADIMMVAYLGGGTTLGQICLTGSTTISSGKGAGSNGQITLIAEGSSGTTPNGTSTQGIETGVMIATNGGSGANGNIDIRAIRPKSSDGNPIVFNANGAITSGNSIVPGSVVPNNCEILLTGDVTAKNSIVMRPGAGVNVVVPKGITMSTTSPTGTIVLGASFNAGVRSEAGSLISTNTLTLTTTTGDFGTLALPVITNATNLNVLSDASTSAGFVRDTANLVVLNGKMESLNVIANNSITNLDGAPIQAFNLNLQSINRNVGFTAGSPIEVDSANVVINAGADAFMHDTFGSDMSLTGSSSAGGTWSFHALNGILAAGPTVITANQIAINTDDAFVIGTNPELHASERIDITSKTAIQTVNFGTTKTTTPLLHITLTTQDLGTSGSHFTPGIGVKAISVDILSATASAFIADPTGGSKKGFLLAGGNVGSLYDYLGTGKTTVSGNLNAAAVNLVTGAGTLAVGPKVSIDALAFILSRVLDNNPGTNKKAKIVLGKNSTLETHANSAGFGSIFFTVGAAPGAPVPGTPPAKGVGFATAGGGGIFWGQQGVTAKTPANSLYAKDANIVFNNTISPKNISLLGGVTISAE